MQRCALTPAAGSLRWTAGLLALGSLALGLGITVYLTDRGGHPVALLVALAAQVHVGPRFGASAAWLPSFVHPFAFGLFTAAVLARTAASAWHACTFWWAVDVVFELLQHPWLSRPVTLWLDALGGPAGVLQPLSRYLRHGTFDPADLAAATSGALAALAVLHGLRFLARPHDDA